MNFKSYNIIIILLVIIFLIYILTNLHKSTENFGMSDSEYNKRYKFATKLINKRTLNKPIQYFYNHMFNGDIPKCSKDYNSKDGGCYEKCPDSVLVEHKGKAEYVDWQWDGKNKCKLKCPSNWEGNISSDYCSKSNKKSLSMGSPNECKEWSNKKMSNLCYDLPKPCKKLEDYECKCKGNVILDDEKKIAYCEVDSDSKCKDKVKIKDCSKNVDNKKNEILLKEYKNNSLKLINENFQDKKLNDTTTTKTKYNCDKYISNLATKDSIIKEIYSLVEDYNKILSTNQNINNKICYLLNGDYDKKNKMCRNVDTKLNNIDKDLVNKLKDEQIKNNRKSKEILKLAHNLRDYLKNLPNEHIECEDRKNKESCEKSKINNKQECKWEKWDLHKNGMHRLCPEGSKYDGNKCSYNRGKGILPKVYSCSEWDKSWRDDGSDCWNDNHIYTKCCCTYQQDECCGICEEGYEEDGPCACKKKDVGLKKTLKQRYYCPGNKYSSLDVKKELCYEKPKDGFKCDGEICTEIVDNKPIKIKGNNLNKCTNTKYPNNINGKCYADCDIGFKRDKNNNCIEECPKALLEYKDNKKDSCLKPVYILSKPKSKSDEDIGKCYDWEIYRDGLCYPAYNAVIDYKNPSVFAKNIKFNDSKNSLFIEKKN